MSDHFLWVEKYRPHKVSDVILPSLLKQSFQKFVDDGNIPNLLLSGPPGTGKTTIAKAMVEEIGSESYVINASMNGNIDTLRNEISQFASSVSMNGMRKYVILDEADHLNPNSFQPALRAFMEEFAKVTGFILTCNYKSRIIEPLHSRTKLFEFRIPKNEYKDIAKQLYSRLLKILHAEKIDVDTKVLAEIVKRSFALGNPDLRSILGDLQSYSQATGKIDVGILSNFTEERLASLVSSMKEKNFTKVRAWVTENSDIETTEMFRKLYNQVSALLKPESIPMLVMILARYQYQSAFVADQDINTAACLAEIMVECTWA